MRFEPETATAYRRPVQLVLQSKPFPDTALPMTRSDTVHDRQAEPKYMSPVSLHAELLEPISKPHAKIPV